MKKGGRHMNATAMLLTLAMIVVWGAASLRLERVRLTAPIVFTAVGAALVGFGLVDEPSAPERLLTHLTAGRVGKPSGAAGAGG